MQKEQEMETETETARSETQEESISSGGPLPKLKGETLRAGDRVWGAQRPREAEGSRKEGRQKAEESCLPKEEAMLSRGGPDRHSPERSPEEGQRAEDERSG